MPCRTLSNASWVSVTPSRSHSISTSAPIAQPMVEDNDLPDVPREQTSQERTEETLQARIERLGRARPPTFPTLKSEILFVFSIIMSQFLTEFFVSGFTLILPTLIEELDVPQASAVWPATAFSLVVGSTLLVFGRLGDMFGGRPVFLAGLVWLMTWSIIAGFSVDPLMLDFSRALQGLGAAAFLPTGVQLMGSLYRPGPRKNLVFAIYGTSAVFGFFGGIALAIGTSIMSIPNTPRDKAASEKVRMDSLGALAIIIGLTLTIFSITQSAHAPSGWRTPYIPVCCSFGVISLLVAIYIETRVAQQPLLPSSIFTRPSMTPLILALFFLYGTWAIFSVYGTLYFQNVLNASPLQVVAWYAPLGVAGLVLSILEGFVLHLVPGRVLLIVSGLGAVGSQLLLALIPQQGANYWAWIFPATVFSTIGIDLSTILMTVFVTTTFSTAQQGLAGGVVNSVLQLGVAFCLGVADIIQSATVEEVGLGKIYKNTFWFGVGAAVMSLVVMAIWGKVPKATSDLTADEKRELMAEAEREGREIDGQISGE